MGYKKKVGDSIFVAVESTRAFLMRSKTKTE